MTIATCPNCAARFKLSDTQTSGRTSVKVKCSRCQTLFRVEVGDDPSARVTARTPAVQGPPPTAPRPSPLDELANMESAGPFLDRAFGEPAGSLRNPGTQRPTPAAAMPSPAMPSSAAPGPGLARSPLDGLGGQPATVREVELPLPSLRGPGTDVRGALDDLMDELQLPPANDEFQPFGQAKTNAGPPRSGTVPMAAAMALESTLAQVDFGGRLEEPPAPPTGTPAQGTARQGTFYPMLEFGQDFRGLGDSGTHDALDNSLPPLASPSAAAAAAAATRPQTAVRKEVPRTQAMEFIGSRAHVNNDGPRDFDLDLDMPAPPVQAGSLPLDDKVDETGLLEYALRRRQTGMRPVVSDEELNKMRFDLVGDLARRSQPRTPYDAWLAGTLVICMVTVSSVVGLAAWKNDGVFDFSDPAGMLELARGERSSQPDERPVRSVLVGDAMVESRAAGVDEYLRVDSVSVSRFRNADGVPLVLVEGTLHNRTDGALRSIVLQVELRSPDAEVVVTSPAVVGTVVPPEDLTAMVDPSAVTTALQAAASRVADFQLEAGQATRFSTVFLPVDRSLAGLVPVIVPVSAATDRVQVWTPVGLDGELPAIASSSSEGSGTAEGSHEGSGAEGSGAEGSSAVVVPPDPPADGSALDNNDE